jgi:hypothetical protein
MKGIVLWSMILGYAFWRAPRALPHSHRLARIAVVCGFVAVLSELYRVIQGVPEWSFRESPSTIVSAFIGGAGMLAGLICGAIAFFIDARRTPSPR